jgi:hypothetical protein
MRAEFQIPSKYPTRVGGPPLWRDPVSTGGLSILSALCSDN